MAFLKLFLLALVRLLDWRKEHTVRLDERRKIDTELGEAASDVRRRIDAADPDSVPDDKIVR